MGIADRRVKASLSDAVVREGGLHLHEARDFPPLRGGIKGGLNPPAISATSALCIRRFSPPSIPPRWGGRFGRALHDGRARFLSPQGRDKGWGDPGCKIRDVGACHSPLLPTLNPSPLGRGARACALRLTGPKKKAPPRAGLSDTNPWRRIRRRAGCGAWPSSDRRAC